MVFHALAKRRFCLRFLSTRENTSLSAFQPFLQYFTAGSDIASFQDYEEKEFVECFSEETQLIDIFTHCKLQPHKGVPNGTSKNLGLGKFWQDLEISEAFLISLEVSFFHGLFLLFLSLETFHQRVSGSDF